ncbi:MAG TPA: autotransporter-associated beta strand repeat-containing protein, partial [Verrucomicrobiae bacterium]|nr:autotransporter-associated beta strand repeat-containing protein [Verrucomicrobiae bacterium]
LTGGGTLNLVVNYVRDELVGDWSAFTGTINVTAKSSSGGDEMRIHNTHGYANATIFLNDGVLMDSLVSSATINIGSLGGTSGAIIGPGNKSSKNPTWVVGWKNTTNTFDGSIEDDGISSIVKVGTGKWILTGQNAYSGSTTVSNGVLALATGTFGDAYVGSSTNFFIASGATLDVSGQSTGTMPLSFGQTLGGSGTVNGILDNTSGGTVAPGDGVNIGTLTVTTNINLGGTVVMKINRGNAQKSDELVSPAISLQGVTVIVTNVGPNLQVNDTFTLFTGALSGSVGSVILPSTYYSWDTSQLAVNGTIKVTAALPLPSISNIDVSGLAGGSIEINASGAPNGVVNVLATTNLATPFANWTNVFSGNFDGGGNLNATISVDPTQPQQFYLLQAQ